MVQVWLVSLKIVFNVSRFKPELNENRFMADLRIRAPTIIYNTPSSTAVLLFLYLQFLNILMFLLQVVSSNSFCFRFLLFSLVPLSSPNLRMFMFLLSLSSVSTLEFSGFPVSLGFYFFIFRESACFADSKQLTKGMGVWAYIKDNNYQLEQILYLILREIKL